jgi:hypothetical protein
MAIFTNDNRNAWQALADDLAGQRPSVGKTVKVTSGKSSGIVGKVTWHGRDKFAKDYYATDAQLTLREFEGRRGYRIRVQPEAGDAFFVDADKVEVIPAL